MPSVTDRLNERKHLAQQHAIQMLQAWNICQGNWDNVQDVYNKTAIFGHDIDQIVLLLQLIADGNV